MNIPIKFLPSKNIEKYAQNQTHQGVILKCEPLPFIRISNPEQLKLEKKTHGLLWLYIDQITDPQNFGALIRTAFYLVLMLRKARIIKMLGSRWDFSERIK